MKLGPFTVPGYHVGDCRDLLRQLPDESIECVVTSPPYWGLRDYGVDGQLGLEKTPQEYVAGMLDVFREVRRVLCADGTLWLNLGDSYHRGGGGNYGDSKSTRTHDQHLTNVRNRDIIPGLKPKDLVGIPWRVAFALQADGWYLRSEIIWHKPNPMPESVTDRPTKAHEQLFLLSKSERYFYDARAIDEPGVKGAAGSLFHTGKTGEHQLGRASKRLRNSDNSSHVPGTKEHSGLNREGAELEAVTRNRRTVWTIPTEPTKDAHFATMPTKLVQPCVLAGCPKGGVVMDPFGGSGTVGRVAEDNGRKWLLFDISSNYAEIAKRKTAQTGLLGLVG